MPAGAGGHRVARRFDDAGDGRRRRTAPGRADARRARPPNCSTPSGARSPRCTGPASPTARCAPPTSSSPTTGPVMIDIGYGTRRRRPRLRRSIAPSCWRRSPASWARAGRRVRGPHARSDRPGGGGAIPSAPGALGGHPQAGGQVDASRTAYRGGGGVRTGARAARTAGSRASSHPADDRHTHRCVLRPAAATGQRRREHRRRSLGELGVARRRGRAVGRHVCVLGGRARRGGRSRSVRPTVEGAGRLDRSSTRHTGERRRDGAQRAYMQKAGVDRPPR